jgi:hypothetical protein
MILLTNKRELQMTKLNIDEFNIFVDIGENGEDRYYIKDVDHINTIKDLLTKEEVVWFNNECFDGNIICIDSSIGNWTLLNEVDEQFVDIFRNVVTKEQFVEILRIIKES